MSQPYFGQVWGWSPTLGKSEDLESSGTPECLEFDNKAQNTSHWGVLSVIGKFLKRRYRKWPRIGHLDIWTFAVQVMGKRRAGSQIGNLTPDHQKSEIDLFPTSELRVRYVVGKISARATSLVQTSLQSDFSVGSYELPKSRDSTRDSFGTISGLQPGSPGKKWHSGVGAAESHRVYYTE
jgi:hypothetical protein